jgi:hypothetical protein
MPGPIRTLLPPGGFSNLVGYHVAALDVGLDALKEAARAVPAARLHAEPAPGLATPARTLVASGLRESAWVHDAVGGVPTPPAPDPAASLPAILGWLDAVRTVSLMVLRPLADRDLERLVKLPGSDAPTSVRRLLSELLEHQAERRGELRVAASLLRRGQVNAP